MRTKSNPCPTQMCDLRTVSSLLGVDTKSTLRSVVQKFPLFNVLKGQNVIDFAYFYETKASAGPILRMCKLGNSSDAGIFLNG